MQEKIKIPSCSLYCQRGEEQKERMVIKCSGETRDRRKDMLGFKMLMLFVWIFAASFLSIASASVSYDHKAIIVNGQRRILISGSIHYPRSTPEVGFFHSKCGSFLLYFSFRPFQKVKVYIFAPFSFLFVVINGRCGLISLQRPKKEAWML